MFKEQGGKCCLGLSEGEGGKQVLVVREQWGAHPYRACGPCGELWSHCWALSRGGTWYCLQVEESHTWVGDGIVTGSLVTVILQVRHIVTQPKLSSTGGEKSLF